MVIPHLKRLLMLGFLLWGLGSGPTAGALAPEDIHRVVLPNGITLLAVEQRALPTVHLLMILRAGAVLDPPGREGLAHLTAAMLDEGTETRTSQEIAEAIDFIGGSLSVGAGRDFATVSLRVLRKDLDTGLGLLQDVLLHPVFPEKELDRLRKEFLGAIESQKADPGAVAAKTFRRLLYRDHPYAHPVIGLEESLPRIQREDLIQFYHRYYRPNRAIVVVVGDLSPQEVETRIRALFQEWKPGPEVPEEIPLPSPLQTRIIERIDRDLTQANIMLGHLGITRDNPDYYAVRVMNYILGRGGFSSRLTKEIRDNRGLAYAVYSVFEVGRYAGAFRVTLQTKNATANEAISLVLQEIERIREEGVTEAELEEAKSYLTGSFPLNLDTNAKLARFLATVEFFGLGLDYIRTYPERIRAVTREDVLRVARKYLHPDRFVLVVVAQQEAARIQVPELEPEAVPTGGEEG